MANRKDSLQRILNERNQHLEEWERQLDIAGNPREIEICKREIAKIKSLIGETQSELNSLDGSGQDFSRSQNLQENSSHHLGYEIPGTVNKGPHDSSINVVDDSRNRKNQATEGNTQNISTSQRIEVKPSKDKRYKTRRPVTNEGNTDVNENKKKDIFRALIIIVIYTVMALLIFFSDTKMREEHCLYPYGTETNFVFSYIIFGIVVNACIFLTYYFLDTIIKPLPKQGLKQGLKLGLSLLFITLYFLFFEWSFPSFGDENAAKIILIPLVIIIIGSILLLIDREKSDNL